MSDEPHPRLMELAKRVAATKTDDLPVTWVDIMRAYGDPRADNPHLIHLGPH